MKRKIAIFAALAALAACAKTFSWRITSPQPVAQTFAAYRGETLEFAPQFCGAMSNVTASALYYQTNGMGTAWWRSGGLVFAPSNDCGAAAYRFFVRAADPLGTDYTANGVLRMLDSPGETPNALPLPVQVLDFAAVEVANAPWPSAEDVAAAARDAADAATNYTDSAVADKMGTLGHQNLTGTLDIFSPYAAPLTLRSWDDDRDGYGLSIGISSNRWTFVHHAIGIDGGIYHTVLPESSGVIALAADIPGAVSNIVTKAYVEDLGISGGGGTPLAGRTFDFATAQGVMDALKATIEALGGTVTNAPEASAQTTQQAQQGE
jgi:hypothetical protein